MNPTHISSKESALYNLIAEQFTEQNAVYIAYSGGVDSTLVAYLATQVLGAQAQSVFFATPLMTPDETTQATHIAESIGLNLHVLSINPLELEAVRMNWTDRCYHCKRFIFENMVEAYPGAGLYDGTNYDDLHSNRPGLRALKELGIKSPLAQAHLSKSDVRTLAEALKLPNAHKPSAPCLATRFSPNSALTPEGFARVAAAESILQAAGFSQVRVRDDYPRCSLEVHPYEVARLKEVFPTLCDALAGYYNDISYAPQGYQGFIG